MDAVAHVRMSGPLTCHVEGFAAELRSHGYSELSLANQLRLMADLSRWLQAAEVAVDKFDHNLVLRFLAKRRRTHTQFITERALAPLLRYLESAGAVSIPVPVLHPRGELLREYERYLVEERAVLSGRKALCLSVAAEFLEHKRVEALQAKDITRFIDARARQGNLLDTLSPLRSVLRFLFVTSKTKLNLVYAVPSVPRWKLTALPQYLEPSELEAAFATCDRRTLAGCRDYAVLVLLGRLGLRASEVAALELDDIDWTAGELLVRGKGRTLGRLPVPIDIGEAIVAYLRRAVRSKTTRALFVRLRAPYDAIQPCAIIGIAKQALRTAGIPSGGAHRFRHTAATQMLRRGASLTEIAQVLRHRHINTTAIYAKVDLDSLRSIARRWPVADDGDGQLRELAQVWPGGVP